MMDCASFENRLTEVLAGRIGDALKQATLADLERHAKGCSECNGAGALVELAALPPEERDPLEVPPESYWEEFNASVAQRLDRAPAERPAGRWRRYAAVAAVVMALFSGWFLRGWLDPGMTPEPPVAAVGEDPGAPDWSRLDEVIRQATPDELAEALRGLPGGWTGIEASSWTLDETGLGGEWLPDIDELGEIDRSELMEWLDQMDQSERRPTS